VDYVRHRDRFVCCIGRNNRDLETFVEAVRRAGVRAVLICREGQADGLALPPGLILRTDVPKAECEEVMEKAMATVVPLVDDSTGAGHMTVVLSLLLGTPVVATRSAVLSDYVRDGETGISVARGDADEMARAFARLAAGGPDVEALRARATAFAEANLTEACAARALEDILTERLGDAAAPAAEAE
jgi:glycosyltransferase involved in cell wall biosynthesis